MYLFNYLNFISNDLCFSLNYLMHKTSQILLTLKDAIPVTKLAS